MKPEVSNPSLPLLPDAAASVSEEAVVRKLNRRLLTIVTAIGLMNCINHNNIGFAANDLCDDLGLTNTEYGLGVMLLYLGLFVLQLFGNEFLKRTGGPCWFALMLALWGAAGVGLGFIQTVAQFYGLVALLGVAQGTTFAGILYYLSLFYPLRLLDAAFSVITASVAFSVPVTSLLSAAIVAIADQVEWESWRSILAVEGAMAIIFAMFVIIFLPNSVETATFLKPEEKQWLKTETDQEEGASKEQSMPFLQQLKSVMSTLQVQIAALSMFAAFGVNTVMIFFINLVIRTTLNGPDQENEGACGTKGGNLLASIGLTAVPYVCSGLACLLTGRTIHLIKNRKRFAVMMQLVSGAVLSLFAPAKSISFVTGFLALTVAITLAFPPQATLFSLGAANAAPEVRGTALAYLTSCFALSGLVFPVIIGKLGDAYGYGWCVTVAGFLGIFAGMVMMFLKDPLMDKDDNDVEIANA